MFASKVTIVTGASQGIGKVIALAFAKQGANLVLVGRNANGLQETCAEVDSISESNGFTEARHLIVPVDLSRVGEIKTLFQMVESEFGTVDVLINNAGIAGPTCPVEEVTEEDWNYCLQVNLTAPMFCTQEAVHLMKRKPAQPEGTPYSDRGVIVNIGSVAGRMPYPYRSAYAAAKWGLNGLSATMAKVSPISTMKALVNES
jgi:NAD(P)-dependent dehydrogenase (short-subunit alcohol dehydrogenase family)